MVDINELRVKIGEPGDPGQLRELLNALGGIISSEFQGSFDRQAFDGNAWPPRYPNQSEPFVNIARLVQVMTEGGSAVGVFDRTPALMGDPPTLMNAIGWRITDDLQAEIGVDFNITPAGGVGFGGEHPASYAGIHNEGGESFQSVNDSTKRNLQKWLEGVTSESKFDKVKQERAAIRDKQQEKKRVRQAFKDDEIGFDERESSLEELDSEIAVMKDIVSDLKRGARPQKDPIRDKVGFLFAVDELKTTVHQRQFVGVTPTLERDVADFVELWIERKGQVRPSAAFGG